MTVKELKDMLNTIEEDHGELPIELKEWGDTVSLHIRHIIAEGQLTKEGIKITKYYIETD